MMQDVDESMYDFKNIVSFFIYFHQDTYQKIIQSDGYLPFMVYWKLLVWCLFVIIRQWHFEILKFISHLTLKSTCHLTDNADNVFWVLQQSKAEVQNLRFTSNDIVVKFGNKAAVRNSSKALENQQCDINWFLALIHFAYFSVPAINN